MSKLKIYACSGLGNANNNNSTAQLTYWQDNTKTYTNTRAVNTLFSKINLLDAEISCLEMSQDEIISKLNLLDLYICCLYAAQNYAKDDDTLLRAGRIIGRLVEDGAFDYNSLSDEERDRNLDSEIATIDARMQSSEDYDTENNFVAWWNNAIISNNFVGFTDWQIQKSKAYFAKNQNVSGTNKKYGDASDFLNDAGEYFLYTYFTDSEAKNLNYIFQRKRKKQLEVYDYCKKCFVDMYGSEEDMKNIIRCGIIKRFNHSPEYVCNEIYENEAKGVGGMGVDDIIYLIIVLVVIITAAVVAGLEYAKEVAVAEYVAPKDPEDSIPSDEEYAKLLAEKKASEAQKLKKKIIAALLAVAAFFVIKK